MREIGDDLGAGELGLDGNTRQRTPNLDKLEAKRFAPPPIDSWKNSLRRSSITTVRRTKRLATAKSAWKSTNGREKIRQK